MSISEILMFAVYTYLSLAFIKFMLMMPSVYMVAGVHLRYIERCGADISPLAMYLYLTGAVIYSSFVGLIPGIAREGFSFFVMYSKRQVLRDSAALCRSMYSV